MAIDSTNEPEDSSEIKEDDRDTAKDDINAAQQDLERASSNESSHPKYSKLWQWSIVANVAFACFLSPISTTMFLPAVPEIAKEFNTTGTIINVSNACYCLMMAVSPCIASPLANIYGTKMIFFVCSLVYAIASFVVSQSRNLVMFFVFRAVMAIFGTAFFSVGSTVIGNIFEPPKRGKPMGFILVGSQAGIAIAAVLGGVIVNYTKWRIIFIVLGGIGILVFVTSIVILPETGSNIKYYELRKETGKRFILIGFNPFKVIAVSKYLNVLLAALASSSLMYNMYCLLTPIRYVMNPAFHLESPLKSALFYLSPGAGYIIGSYFGGKWSDYFVRKYMAIRDERIPEDRLKCLHIWFGLMIPFSNLLYGWSLDKKKGGMALPIIAMFINGFSQTMCFPSINAYCVDSMPHLRGAAIANNYSIRFLASGVASGTVLVQIDQIGIGWTCTISAFVALAGYICVLALIKYGESSRLKNGCEKVLES